MAQSGHKYQQQENKEALQYPNLLMCKINEMTYIKVTNIIVVEPEYHKLRKMGHILNFGNLVCIQVEFLQIPTSVKAWYFLQKWDH